MLFFISCGKSQVKTKPSYITFDFKGDSILVIAKNPVLGKSFLKIKNLKTQKENYIDFVKPNTLTVLGFHKNEIDSLQILENYKFTLYYGLSSIVKYDTLYNYSLPFLKGKRFKVLQGQNSKFTHKGDFSRYAIDFKMRIGETICSIRDGIVVSVKEDSNKGGRSEKYKSDGNYIVIAHKDDTFSQYVHLKKDGVIVEKGDSVLKGQKIGYSGNTGQSTEPHLHFAVYKPTKNGLISIPIILDSIPSKKYKKGRYAINN
ncbi:MAG: M23 family metallopeptidase [Polaribacter sp.]|uniref:M23 family metallopeptidase n=1 Tax=Polaribacter sp. TaxID=1920175 RepID=UPI003BB1EFA4